MSCARCTILSIAALLGSLLCLAAAPVAAQTWQIDYDPALGTKPSAQGWTHYVDDPLPDDGLDENNYWVALGVLAQGDTGGPNTDPGNLQSYEVTPPDFNFDDEVIVFDLRLKMLASTHAATYPPTAGFGVAIRDNAGKYVTFFVGSTDVLLVGHPQLSVAASYDSTLAYSDYQLRIDRNGASLFVDGVLLVTLDRDGFGYSFFNGVTTVSLGDIAADQSSSSQIQSFRIARFNPPQAEVRGYERLTQYLPSEFTSDSTSIKSLTVSCPSGRKALGGGVETIGADGDVGLLDSHPSGGPPATSWTGSARELVDTGADWRIRVDVICGEISGYESHSVAAPQSTDAFQNPVLDCPTDGKIAVGGGSSISGANLRQTLLANRPLTNPSEWNVIAEDYGQATSSSPWGVEIDAICSDALELEEDGSGQVLGFGSPRQAIFNCTSRKVPISGGAGIADGTAGPHERALRISRPKDGGPGDPPVGWLAAAQVDTASMWSVEAHAICAPIADPTVSKNGLVTRWRGSDAGGDSWGPADGTLENGATLTPSFLGQGQAFSLDGASEQWVQIPSYASGSHSLYPEASFTVDAWIQTSTLPPTDAVAYIVNLYEYGGLNGLGTNASYWGIYLNDQGRAVGAFRDPRVNLTTASNVVGPASANLADGQPHHIALMRDSEPRQARLYIDGILEVTAGITYLINDGPLTPGSPAAPDPVAIGVFRKSASTELTSEFTGQIDDVKYYDRALSKDEIQNTAGCYLPIVPRVLNLDAALFGSKAAEGPGLCVFLEAGDYRATLVTPALDPDARLTAWSPSPTSPWSTLYVADREIDGTVLGGFPTFSAAPQLAFDATAIKELDFTLSVDQRVHFTLVDDEVLDNRGGVSVRIEYVPEPGSVAMSVSGSALLAFLSRRRSRKAERRDSTRSRAS